MKRSLTSVLVLVLLFTSSLILIGIPALKDVHAFTVNGTCNGATNSGTSQACTGNITTSAGDIVIVVVTANWGPGTISVSGSGLTYTDQVSNCASTNFCAQIWTATDSTGHAAWSATASTSGAASSVGVFEYSVTGISASAAASAGGTCNIACAVQNPSTSSSISATGRLAVAGVYINTANGQTAGSGYTLITTSVAGINSEYATALSGNTNFPETYSSQASVWADSGAVFAAAGATVPIKCTVAGPGTHSNANFGITGGSPAPSTLTCSTAGTTNNIVFTPNAWWNVTMPADNATTRFRYSNNSVSFPRQWFGGQACASGTCTMVTVTVYYQLKNNFVMIPTTPSTWDAAYTEPLKGTSLGVASTTLANFILSSGGGATTVSNIWADYDLAVGPPVSFASSVQSGSWVANATNFLLTTGGNTKHSGYIVQGTPTFVINALAQTTFDNAMTLNIIGTLNGVGGTIICTITTTVAASAQCSGTVDFGTTVMFATTLTGAPANSRWENQFGTTYTSPVIVGPQTISLNYYKQWLQTYKYSITCAPSATCSTAPTLSYTALGASTSLTETMGALTVYIDASSTASISVTLTDNKNNVYSTTPTSWLINAANLVGNPSAYVISGVVTVITGWLVPDATHLGNSLLLIMIPLGCMLFATLLAQAFKTKGDIIVYFALGGLFIGSILADLSATGVATNAVPFALIFISGLFIFLWWWDS